MKEELYIDVISKTIIARMSETVARFVSERLDQSMRRILLAEIPAAFSREITPSFEALHKENSEFSLESGELLNREIEKMCLLVSKESEELKATINQTVAECSKSQSAKVIVSIDQLAQSFDQELKNIGEKMTESGDDQAKKFSQSMDDKLKGVTAAIFELKNDINSIFDDRIDALEEANKQLCSETKELRQQMAEQFKKQGGILANVLLATKKMARLSFEKDWDRVEKMEDSLDLGLKAITDLLQREKINYRDLKIDFKSMLDEEKGNTQKQSDLLNSIYYSIRKVASLQGKEQGLSSRIEEQFETAVRELNKLVRILVEQKDDAFSELIRVAGDDYMKSKLEEQEAEIEKVRTLAEKRLQEKEELEQKIEQLQSVWDRQ